MDSYVRCLPHPALTGLVVDYGGYREFSVEPLRRRQAPTGVCAMILGLGPPLRLHGPAGPLVPTSFLAGMHDSAVVTQFVGEQLGLQVNLTPLGVFTLLGRPTADLTNRTPALDELGVPALRDLPERLRHDCGWAARFARVDATLLSLLDASTARPDPEVAWAWRRLVRASGAVGVADLAEGTGWSRRHLLTRFRSQVGLAPKAAGRVLRFQRAAQWLVPTLAAGGPGARRDATIAEIAADCGYADHAHLDREFRSLAGCTPTEYVAGWACVPIRSSAAAPAVPTVTP
jgi:AraC-like DNA-binding protein